MSVGLALTLSLALALTWMLALTLYGPASLTDQRMDFGSRDPEFRTLRFKELDSDDLARPGCLSRREP
jgi:hypothetical protein